MNTRSDIFGKGVDFGDMPSPYFLVGLLNAFNNRFQSLGDSLFEELSWKQAFLINCITFYHESPTIQQLSELIGSSHQNTKHLLDKLQQKGYVLLGQDTADRRKQRVSLTERAKHFRENYSKASDEYMERLFEGVSKSEIDSTIAIITKLHTNIKTISEGAK